MVEVTQDGEFRCVEKMGKLQMEGATLVAQLVKNLPVIWETPAQSLEKGSATHSSILGLPWWLRQ